MKIPCAAIAGSLLLLAGCGGDRPASTSTLKITGSTTVNPPVAEAADLLREARGWTIHVDTQGGSSGGVAAVGEGRAQLGMASRPLTIKDAAKFPEAQLVTTTIGSDALAIVVSKDVWDGGVKGLTKTQVRDIYESKTTNWKELGGPDQEIVFFNKEPGRGTWEVFAAWAYGGDANAAPPVNHPEVGANAEARTKVASTRGGVTQLSSAWTDGETVFALAVDGTSPTPEAIASGAYPISRPLNLLTDGEPAGMAAEFIEFMLGPEGQALLPAHGYQPLP